MVPWGSSCQIGVVLNFPRINSLGRKKKAPDPLGLEKMRLSSQSPDDTRVAESAWELVCVGTRQPSPPSTSTKALYLASWSPITEGRLLNNAQEEKCSGQLEKDTSGLWGMQKWPLVLSSPLSRKCLLSPWGSFLTGPGCEAGIKWL